jgi:pimeloyl-ACP methyl ester carboxylesterase
MIGRLGTAPWRGIRAIAGGAPQPDAEGRHTLNYREYRLNYEVYGSGDRVLVWLHGLLLDANLSRGLARALAARGNRVVLLDLLGHGRSEKPRHSSAHRMDLYAEQVLCLLDELGVDQVVLGGVSLGTNVSLLTTVRAPERVRGLVLEMPVLESAAPAAALTFVPLLLEMHYAQAALRPVTRVISRLPLSGIGPLDSLLRAAGSDPTEIAAVLHGMLLGPIAPTVEQRQAITAPALVLGHGIDLIHSFADAKRLARQLPDARLIRTRTFAELWVTPARLTAEIAKFLDRVWADDEPGNPVRPCEAALPGLTAGWGLAGSSWPASAVRLRSPLPRTRFRSRLPPGCCRSRLPSGRFRSRLPPGRCRSRLPPGRCRSRLPPGCCRSRLPPGRCRSRLPPGRPRSRLPPGC